MKFTYFVYLKNSERRFLRYKLFISNRSFVFVKQKYKFGEKKYKIMPLPTKEFYQIVFYSVTFEKVDLKSLKGGFKYC